MYKAFKKETLLYFIISLTGAALLLFFEIGDESILSGLLLAFAWIFICTIVFGVVMVNRDIKMTRLLNDCRPAEYIVYAEKMISAFSSNKQRNPYYINFFAAYMDMGEAETAAHYLAMVEPVFSDDINGKMTEHIYHINLCSYYIGKGDLERAEHELRAAEEPLSSPKLSAVASKLLPNVRVARYAMEMKKGNYEGVEDFFTGLFQEEKTRRGKVTKQFTLAELYYRLGQAEKMKEACEYVIANGRETCYVRMAKEMPDGKKID